MCIKNDFEKGESDMKNVENTASEVALQLEYLELELAQIDINILRQELDKSAINDRILFLEFELKQLDLEEQELEIV